jgi:hypothetical protein
VALGEDDLKQVSSKVAEILKETLASDDFKKALGGVVRPIVVGVVQAETKTIVEKNEELAGKLGELDTALQEAATKGGEPGSKGGKQKDDESEELKALRAKLDSMVKKDQEREAARLKEREEAKRAARKARFVEAASGLEMLGIPQAWAFLEGQLEDGESDDVLVRVKRDGYEEKLPLKAFLSDEFPKTEDGKIHYRAKGGGGSGGKQWSDGGGAGGSGGKQADVGGLLDSVGWGSGGAA